MRDYGEGIGRDAKPVLRGWQKSGKLKMLDTARSVSMQADFPDPGNYTIQFSIQTKINPAPFGQKNQALAEIEWTVEGGTIKRVISIGNGTSITGVAQAVKVRVIDDTRTGTAFAAGFDPEYLISMQVVKGTRPAVNRPPSRIPANIAAGGGYQALTNGYTILPSGGGVLIPVPEEGAISVSVQVQDASVGGTLVPEDSIAVLQRQHSGASTILSVCDPRDFDWIPLSPACGYILVANYNAFDVAVSVAFGIDG